MGLTKVDYRILRRWEELDEEMGFFSLEHMETEVLNCILMYLSDNGRMRSVALRCLEQIIKNLWFETQIERAEDEPSLVSFRESVPSFKMTDLVFIRNASHVISMLLERIHSGDIDTVKGSYYALHQIASSADQYS
jgi:hypothetical protein